jgi:predicted negative regulator of RcsB-dependent stress response
MTDIATVATELQKEESFIIRQRKAIIAVVIIIVVIVIAWYCLSGSRANFVVSEISKKIDELVKTINEKQNGSFRS